MELSTNLFKTKEEREKFREFKFRENKIVRINPNILAMRTYINGLTAVKQKIIKIFKLCDVCKRHA